jgi:hypothetical protein
MMLFWALGGSERGWGKYCFMAVGGMDATADRLERKRKF